MSSCHSNSTPAFTIVELLVVIVVIGILAAITIVSYSGITNRATISSLQSDLDNSSRLLRMYQVEHGVFPTSFDGNNCPLGATAPSPDTKYCIKPSGSNTYTYKASATNSNIFCLTSTKGTQSYNISPDTQPLAGPCPVLSLDAGNKTSYSGTGTAWNDLSGWDNNGVLNGGATYDAAGGGVMSFDGVDDYVGAGNLGTFYDQGTISFWMNASAVENYRNVLTTKYNGSNACIRFEESAAGTFGVNIGNDAGTFSTGAYLSSSLTANTWYHVILIWDKTNNNIKGYLNGVNKFDKAQTLWPTTLPAVTIGEGFDLSRYWKGLISDIRIYDRAISGADTIQNFNTLKGRYGL